METMQINSVFIYEIPLKSIKIMKNKNLILCIKAPRKYIKSSMTGNHI